MRPEQDAYGELLYDFYTGENPKAGEIIERDDGLIQYTGLADHYFTEYADWTNQIQEGIDHATGTILDIGCGAGRHALYLQQEGYNVRAIDFSPKAIAVTKERGVEQATIAGIDGVHTLPEAPYDTILLLGNNLGLLGSSPIERLQYLAKHTTDEGVIIGQTREATKTDKQEHTQYHEYNKARGRRPGNLRIRIRYKHFKTPWYDYLYIDPPELKQLLNKTPWNIEQLYTSNTSTNYTVILTKN